MKIGEYARLPQQIVTVEDYSAELLNAENFAYQQTMEALQAIAAEFGAFNKGFIETRTNLKPIVTINSLQEQLKPMDPTANPDRLVRYSVSYVPNNSHTPLPSISSGSNIQSRFVDPTWHPDTKLRVDLAVNYPYNGRQHVGGTEIRPVASFTISGLVNKEIYDRTIGIKAVLGRYPQLEPEGLSIITAYLDRANPAAGAELTEEILKLIYPLIDTTKHQSIAVPATEAISWRQRLLGRKS